MTDLSKQEFGKLTVVGPTEGRHGYWLCKCACGEYLDVRVDNLKRVTKTEMGCRSCGKRGQGGRPKLENRLGDGDVKRLRGGLRMGDLAREKGVSLPVMRRWVREKGVRAKVEGKQVILGMDEAMVVRVLVGGGSRGAMARALGVGMTTMDGILAGAQTAEDDGRSRRGKGERAREVWKMARRGMSEREIAVELGVARARVGQILAWELGRRVIEKLAKVRERDWLERSRKENEG